MGDLLPARLGVRQAPALVALPAREARALVIVLPGGGLAYDKHWAAGWLPFADLPAVRAYVDLPLHGERLAADLRERWRGLRVSRFFAPAILGMVEELPSIVDELRHAHGELPVALCGWSIGGLAAFLAVGEGLDVAALAGFAIPGGGVQHLRLNDTADAPSERDGLDRLDLPPRAARLAPTPVLLQHGDADEWVVPDATRTLLAALEPAYAAHPQRLRHVEYPGVAHDPCDCPPGARRAIAEDVTDWLRRWLPG